MKNDKNRPLDRHGYPDGWPRRKLPVTLAAMALLASLAGCGAISATTLRCGTDGESSYLELVSAPQQIGSSTRAIGDMCAFAYQTGGPVMANGARPMKRRSSKRAWNKNAGKVHKANNSSRKRGGRRR